jgi:hypothetical protein
MFAQMYNRPIFLSLTAASRVPASPNPVNDAIHQISPVSDAQINSETDFPNGIFEDLRPLIACLFTDEYSVD